MLNITLDLDTGLAKLAAATTIKAGAQVPVTISTFRGATPTSPGASPAWELGLGTDASPPVLKAYLATFVPENAHTFTGVLNANDTRLVTAMASSGTTNFGCEVAWTVAGELQVAPSFTVPVQPRIIPSDPTSEGGPDFYTEIEVNALIAALATSIAAKIPKVSIATNGHLAVLNADGTLRDGGAVPSSSAYTPVADAAARHALTPHVGDIVLQADTSHRWIACDVALSATDEGWQDLGVRPAPPSLLIATYVSDISGWTVAGGSAAFTLVGSDVFLSDAANATAIVIASGLNSGGTSVFDFTGCANVTSFAGDSAMAGGLDLLPFAAMTFLGDSALYGCSGLTSLTLPSGLTSIGDSALTYCSGLGSLTLPSGLTSIGASALGFCTGLGSLTLPSGLTSIGDYALYYCSGLGSLTLPSGLTSLGDYALAVCSGLTSLTLPSGLTSIGTNALADSGFTSLHCLAPTAPTFVGSIISDSPLTEIHVPTTATGYGSTYSGLTVIADL